MRQVVEFCTEEYANMFARRAAVETGKVVYIKFDKIAEKYKVEYETEDR